MENQQNQKMQQTIKGTQLQKKTTKKNYLKDQTETKKKHKKSR